MITHFVTKVYAAIKVNVDPPAGGIAGLAQKFGGTEADLTSVMNLIGAVIKLAFGLAGIFALTMFLYGGVFSYMTSFGNEDKIKKANLAMLWSFLGLVIIAASYTIINRLTSLFK